MNLVIKIALGVILAVVIMGISAALIEFYAEQEMQESLQRQQNRIKQQHEAKLRDQKIQRLLTIKENEKKAEDQRSARAKQQAWYAWYNKRESKGCDNWQSDRHMVECINKKMDLKSEFETVWNSQHNLYQQ